MDTVKLKICLAGEAAVGKTSLIRRFVRNEFDDRYISTFGAKVSKKEIDVTTPQGGYHVVMNLWDIMGMKTVRELLWEAYFHGAQGIMAVCDLTRQETIPGLHPWVSAIQGNHGVLPMVVLANKVDLVEATDEVLGPVVSFARNYDSPYLTTSAKTGANVEEAFIAVSRQVLRQRPLTPKVQGSH